MRDAGARPIAMPNFENRTTLEELRQLLQTFATERNWDQFHLPRNLVLAMVSTGLAAAEPFLCMHNPQVGEVGELSEIFQWRGECAPLLPGMFMSTIR